jgi:DNA ligase-associated metallophosphoesterase
VIDADVLHSLVLNNFAIPLRFCNSRIIVDGRGILFWPANDLIIFSDLHFEKGSFLTQFANPLPRFDTKETIRRMQAIIDEYAPSHVVCLGDSFHDINADKRIQIEDVNAINEMIAKVGQWSWVLGNHDPAIPKALDGQSVAHLLIDSILLVHEPEELSSHAPCKGQIVGHYHPKSSYKINQRRITGKSFLKGEDLMIMPAFGKYTGGLSHASDAIKALFDSKSPEVLLSYNKKLFML